MIFRYDSLHAFLSDELRRRVRVNPRYSLRSFARNLRMSPGALSEVLRGRRDVSLRSIPEIAKAIGLNAAEGKHLLHLAQTAKLAKNEGLRELDSKPVTANQHILTEDLFGLISDWYHFAILNLLECEDFEWKAAWISNRLGISRTQAQMGMDLLVRMQLVKKANGKIVGTNDQVLSPTDIPSAAIRNYHRQILEKAIRALELQSLSEREISGCGFAVDVSHLPAIKKELSEFQDRLVAKYAKGKKTEVYFLELALFKLTEGSKP